MPRTEDSVQNTNYRHSSWSHGYSRTKIYSIWTSMIQRCTNPNDPGWKNYGGRGISVCERWMSFINFMNDMGPRPTGLRFTLERMNNNGNYEPYNCKWATYSEQHKNKRTTDLITFNGETLCQVDWSLRLGGAKNLVSTRINIYGWTPERAVSTPSNKKFTPKKWKKELLSNNVQLQA